MIVVYIAGPFRAASAWEVELNIRRAEALALDVWKAGAVAICPHTNTRFFDGALPDQVWLEGDLELVRRSDAVILADRWFQSNGTERERQEAEAQGIPVFETLGALERWLVMKRMDEAAAEIIV